MTEPAHVLPQVLTAASHELRGPLGVARGYLRLLETQVQDRPEALRSLALAGRATDQVAALLDEVSRYARLARGEARLHPAPVPLLATIETAIPKILLPAVPPVTVVTDVPSSTTVWADAAATAEICAALGTALARAAVEGGTLVFQVPPSSGDGGLVLTLHPAETAGPAAERRPPRLDRAGAGLALALAELSLRLQGGSLSELWVDGRWCGYRLGFGSAVSQS